MFSFFFLFVFLLLFESGINIFKTISLWCLCLSVKNEIIELKILHVEIRTFWSMTISLLKSTLLNAILNTKLNKFIWKWVFVLKNMPKRLFHLFPFKKNIVSKAIRYMLHHFRNRRVVKAIWYIIYTETMHDKWKQTPIRYGF